MKIGIYKITNLKNGKFYIGSSKNIDRRWWEHINELPKVITAKLFILKEVWHIIIKGNGDLKVRITKL